MPFDHHLDGRHEKRLPIAVVVRLASLNSLHRNGDEKTYTAAEIWTAGARQSDLLQAIRYRPLFRRIEFPRATRPLVQLHLSWRHVTARDRSRGLPLDLPTLHWRATTRLSPTESGDGCVISRATSHGSRVTRLLVIVGHPRHLMRWLGFAPERGHLRIIGGDKIADGDAHGPFAEELSGRIVVRCGDFQHIVCRKLTLASSVATVSLRETSCSTTCLP